MTLITKINTVFILLLIAANDVYADDKTNAVINKVVTTYGGEALIKLKSLKLNDKYKSFRYGQSYSPQEVDLQHSYSSVTADLINHRNNFRWIRGEKTSFSTQNQIFDGKKGYQVNHTDQTLTPNDNLSFTSTDRRHLIQLDAYLAYLLNQSRDNAAYEGNENIRGTQHEKITFQPDGYPKMTLNINADNHQISSMVRAHWQPNQFFHYNFSGFKKTNGIFHSTSTYITRGGKPYSITTSRELFVNPDISKAFELPLNYGKAAATLDFSKMSVSKLADNVYLAGKDWGFSLFIATDDYFMVAGGYDGLTDRFNAVKAFSKMDKPLKYIVVSHHHTDHIGGMKEAEKLGASFITAKENIDSINIAIEANLPENRFLTLDDKGVFSSDNIKVFDFPTQHAYHHLMTYIPSAKIVFTADFYFSRQHSGEPEGYQTLKNFKDHLKTLNFDFDYLAAAHSGRVLTKENLENSIANISNVKNEVCPINWDICTDYQ